MRVTLKCLVAVYIAQLFTGEELPLCLEDKPESRNDCIYA